MRKIILFVAIVFGVMGVNAQVTVFTETFDNTWYALNIPTASWTSDQDVNSASAWHRNDVTTNWNYTGGSPILNGANSALYYARFHSYGIANGLSTSLSTGNIDLSSYVSCSLTFYYINPSGSDNLNVYFSNDGGVTWSSAVGAYGDQTTTWNQKTIAIPVGYQVSNFRIKYTATSDYGNDDIGLDQVVVTGTLAVPCSTVPTLATTTSASSISGSGASSGGNVTSAGTGACTVTARGVCWRTTSGPTIADSKTSDGTGTGVFTSSITGLTANTLYYVRSYATNGFGTAYGAEISFTTAAACTTVPVLAATTSATSITGSGASSGGNVTSAGTGGCTVTARGVCWSTSANPTLGAGNYTSDGTGTGTFTSTIAGLSGNTLYYVRSYATNGFGTAYGAEISFTTSVSYCIPTYSQTATADFVARVYIPGTTLDNPTTGAASPYYTLYPQSGITTATLTQGTTYTLTVKGGTYSSCYISAWIDYNNDGDFDDAGEFIGASSNCGSSASVNITAAWLIPGTSATGSIRMRLRSTDTSPGPSSAQSCGAANSGWGETEDYIVTIEPLVTPTIVLSTNNVAAANMPQASTNNPIYSFGISPTVASASLTGLTVTTTGTYASTDITNLKCYYQSSSTFNAGTATLLSTLTTPGAAGSKTFPSFTAQTITKDATGYIFITADVACAAATTKTIAISAVTGTNTTFASGTATGTPAAGNTQTISALASVANVTGAAASVAVSSSVVSWTNVSCFDEIMIVAAAGSNSGTPSGDGTAYTANLAYSGGTALGNGYVVYKGSAATATVTGLTNGINYCYKIFTRKGTIWSSGVEVCATPTSVLAYCIPSAATTTRHIKKFSTTNGVTNITNDNQSWSTGGYGDYTAMSASQIQGGTVNFSINGFGLMGYAIWIDYNQDGDFADAGEKVFATSAYNNSASGSFTVPGTASFGSTRMRVAGLYQVHPADPCANTATEGEFEDYTFIVASNVCASATVMSCGTQYSATLNPSSGDWTTYTGGYTGYTGSEKVFKFTAPVTGSYTFDVNEGTADADFFLMSTCGNTGTNLSGSLWGGASGGSSHTVSLTAGTTYYLIADLKAAIATTVSVRVNCPTACDASTVMECGTEYTATLTASGGVWDLYTGGYGGYVGSEKVWSFIPSVSGIHTFIMSGNPKFFLMSSCSNTSTILVGEWSGTQTIALTAGVTYYLIADCKASSSGSVSVKITCPTTDINMSTGTTNVYCGTTYNFYDSGGSASNYGNSENRTHTFTSSNSNPLKMIFSVFNTEATNDKMTIYDGVGTGGAVLLNGYSGAITPGEINSTSTSLTVVFTSDGGTVAAGWAATVTCDVLDVVYGSPSCGSAVPFCATNDNPGVNFGITSTIAIAPDGQCGFMKNPTWWYLKISDAGNLDITIESSCGDVDFACYGPFANLTCDLADLTNNSTSDYFDGAALAHYHSTNNTPVETILSATGYIFCKEGSLATPSGKLVDFGGSKSSAEYLQIRGAVVGQYYMVLIGNFSQCAGNVSFTQTNIGSSGACDCSIVNLPVELTKFDAECVGGNAKVHWQTASEVNNDYFLIEKMSGINVFHEIGRVKGSGNSNSLLNYHFVDDHMTQGENYYRLTQVDYDGKTTIYNTISLNCNENYKGQPIMEAYPNPFENEVNVVIKNITDGDFTLQILDDLGRVVYSEKFTATESVFQTKLSLATLRSAVYNLRCITKGDVLNSRVVKR